MKKRLTRQQILSIKDMRANGQTTFEIALLLHVTSRTVQYWVSRMKEEGIEAPTTVKRGSSKVRLA